VTKIANGNLPGAPELRDSGDSNVAAPAAQDVFESLGVTDRKPDIVALDPGPEVRLGGPIGESDGQPFDNERGLVQRLDQIAHF